MLPQRERHMCAACPHEGSASVLCQHPVLAAAAQAAQAAAQAAADAAPAEENSYAQC